MSSVSKGSRNPSSQSDLIMNNYNNGGNMKIDGYTKFILTMIAFALTLNAVNPWIMPTNLEAAGYDDFIGMQAGLEYIADAIRNYKN